jgi:hypothetical protein
MRVKMKVVMSGTRNGESWPLPGDDVDVPDDEGASMCANGLAVPVRSDEDDVEKRETPQGGRKKQNAQATAGPGEKRG